MENPFKKAKVILGSVYTKGKEKISDFRKKPVEEEIKINTEKEIDKIEDRAIQQLAREIFIKNSDLTGEQAKEKARKFLEELNK